MKSTIKDYRFIKILAIHFDNSDFIFIVNNLG
jgi:hypothetical protein